MRRKRKGEHTCRCSAYRFPHRFGGGACSGFWVAEEYWESHEGSGECRECHYLDTTEDWRSCQIVHGGESHTRCPVFQDFIRANDIQIKPDWN